MLKLIKKSTAHFQDARSYKYKLYFYISSEGSKNEIENIISFTIASKRIKYLEVNLTQDVQNLYLGNYETLLKEMKTSLNKWKDISFSCIRYYSYTHVHGQFSPK